MMRRFVSCSVVGVLATACAAGGHAANDATEVTVPPAASSASSQPAADGSRTASSSASASASATTSPVAPPGASADAPAALCPPTFAQAYDGAHCSIGDAPCVYPEGSCECGGFPQCGGAAFRPEPPGGPGRRYCTASDPGWRRPDGCTDGTPKEGARCGKPGQVCKYGPCGWGAITATCRSGAWHLTQDRGPPPP